MVAIARCGCAGFTSCACLVSVSGALGISGSGGATNQYVIDGPKLSVNPTSNLNIVIAGAGTTASPWLISAKPKVYTTATRPSAVTLGDGAMIYDTTINKPIWSDGAVWRDATGTAA